MHYSFALSCIAAINPGASVTIRQVPLENHAFRYYSSLDLRISMNFSCLKVEQVKILAAIIINSELAITWYSLPFREFN